MANLFPSLIAADLLNLQKTIELLDPYVAGYHLDIMDDHFVPNLTWGPTFINAIARSTKRQIWVHLMVSQPETWIERLELPQNSLFTFHLENNVSVDHMNGAIRAQGWVPSVALNPGTELSFLDAYLELIPHFLLMSVSPGFSGQPFIPSTFDKLERLSQVRREKNLTFKIGVDGGINAKNIAALVERGANDFAIASAIFDTTDLIAATTTLQQIIS